MKVVKRDGTLQDVHFDKITSRIQKLVTYPYRLCDIVDPVEIAKQVCARVFNKITTSELDELAANICMGMILTHSNFGELGARIVINNHQKNTIADFTKVVEILANNTDICGEKAPLVSETLVSIVKNFGAKIEEMIDYTRDYNINFFGFKTLQKAYLLKVNKIPIERPQHMWMRVAIGLHSNNFEKVKETYDLLSQKFFIHATPTLFHAGTPRPQCSSCFLMGSEDSIEGIYKTITDASVISKWAGGIGIHISNIRGKGSYIRKTGGYSSGIMPMLKVYNDTARYVNQSGKRQGSFAMYLEPWHSDIFQFLDAKKNHGNEDERARDLFYGLWIPDLFMKRVENNQDWCLMCPDQCPGLVNVYGKEFEDLYQSYESSLRYIKKIPARQVWEAIINSQIETGMPYMLYKDSCNKKSNQKNLGTIRSSNLCTEIIEYSNEKEYAVCNLGSLSLPAFLKENNQIFSKNLFIIYTKDNCGYCKLAKALLTKKNISYREINIENNEKVRFNLFEDKKEKTLPQIFMKNFDDNTQIYIGGYSKLWNLFSPVFDYDLLFDVTKVLTKNLDRVIDINFYPLEETRNSNMKHRPIGIGVQGLADVFIKMRLPFDSDSARKINKKIFETIYFASLVASNELATEKQPYPSYLGSPISDGIFQFDMWDESSDSLMWNWEELRGKIKKTGVRNSLLVAPMPTASTSQILGNNEAMEPYTSNLYIRRTLAGEFTVINKHLMSDLEDLGIWDQDMKDKIIYHRGSVQNITEIPLVLRNIYKTAWELKQKSIVDQAIDRGRFICQSQSLNIFCETPNYELLTKIHFYGWKKGLKTGSYYIRSKPSMSAQQFTIDPRIVEKIKNKCEEEVCEMCSG